MANAQREARSYRNPKLAASRVGITIAQTALQAVAKAIASMYNCSVTFSKEPLLAALKGLPRKWPSETASEAVRGTPPSQR
jgi:hypothetical protein